MYLCVIQKRRPSAPPAQISAKFGARGPEVVYSLAQYENDNAEALDFTEVS